MKYGTTRLVFEFKNSVVKIPNFTYSWQHFLKGLIANISERNTWRWSNEENKKLLAPVIWSSCGGWLLIMKKADVHTHDKEVREEESIEMDDIREVRWMNEQRYKKWIDAGLGGDDKCDNYGYYENRLVKIDYAY